jgi:hypothetical protein
MKLIGQNEINELKSKDWQGISQNGFWISLIAEDMEFDAWEAYCHVVNADPAETSSIKLLCIAHKIDE